MASKVYFASARVKKWTYAESMPGKLERLLGAIGMENIFSPGEWVAVKTHFGSEGAHRIVRPVFVRKVVDALKAVGAEPLVTDTVRMKGAEYLEAANVNGLNHLSMGAPVVLADGLYGNDNILVKAGEILGEVAVATLIHDTPAMAVLSHVKGHINAGYAGAIKNLAMGGVSAAHRHRGWKCGRGAIHAAGSGKLSWDAQKCELCNACLEICPLECIRFTGEDNRFEYDLERCWHCGRCTRVCPENGALVMQEVDDGRFMRSLAEAAAAVLSTFKPGKVLYVNFLTEIQPECDCMPGADVPVIQDQGILVSDDLVAVEQASIDMLKSAPPLPQSAASEVTEGEEPLVEGADILHELTKKPYMLQLEEARRLGLGSEDYTLATI